MGLMNLRLGLCALCVVALAPFIACGGGQPEAAAPSNPPAASSEAAAASTAPSASASAPAPSGAPAASASAAPSAPPGPPGPGDWDAWTHEQKLAYMKSTVMPQMGQLFHEYDAKKYAEPQCVLCHGAGVKDGSFKMPNPGLPKLDATPEGFKKLHTKFPGMVEFMGKKVVPTTAQLLGEAPFDPKTGKGLGCFECHTKKK